MVEQILDYIHNYFIKDVHKGKFTIEGGQLALDDIRENQYYKIIGSIFNDGVHQRVSTDVLEDEVFEGEVWTMAVPKALIALDAEIEDWLTKYGDRSNSPFASESFGGYSYTKSSGSSNNGSPSTSWQSVFGSRLNQWRKIS